MFSKTETVPLSENKKDAQILIIGAGVIGMTTAYQFLKKGYQNVTIYSKDNPLNTNSDVAAALWRPYGAEPEDKALAWSEETYSAIFDIYYQFLQEKFRNTDEIDSNLNPGISFEVDLEYFVGGTEKPGWMKNADKLLEEKIILLQQDIQSKDKARSLAAEQLLKLLREQRDKIPSIIKNAPQHPSREEKYASVVPLMDSSIYRKWLLHQYNELSKKDVVIKTIHSLEEDSDALKELATQFDVIINCAGEQARNLSKEAETIPIRGLVALAKIPSELNYSIGVEPNPDADKGKIIIAYAIIRPESQNMVVGGTYEEPVSGNPIPKELEKTDSPKKERDADLILTNIVNLIPCFKSIDDFEIIELREGFRCGRKSMYSDLKLVQLDGERSILLGGAFGHGGGGYSVSHGVALHIVDLCNQKNLELNKIVSQHSEPQYKYSL